MQWGTSWLCVRVRLMRHAAQHVLTLTKSRKRPICAGSLVQVCGGEGPAHALWGAPVQAARRHRTRL